MKKVYLLLFAMGMFTFVACNMGAQEGEETSTDVEVEEVTEQSEEGAEESELLADHVCNDNCTEESCHLLHGEKGHACSDECGEKGEHPHGEGEEHPHGDDETTEG